METSPTKTLHMETSPRETPPMESLPMETPPMETSVDVASPRKAAIAFIFAIVLLDVIALGIVIPVLPKLIETMVGGDTPHAAEIFGLFGTSWALMQFTFSPLLGALSDRFGRRPVLLISMTGHGLDYVLMALAPSLVWLFIGRIISGITAASFSTAYAYIADITPADKRAGAFGMVGAAFGIANAAYGCFLLPESLAREHRMAFSWSRANPVAALRLLSRHPELIGLAGVAFLYQLAHAVLPAVTVLYTSFRYGWNNATMGLTLAAVGIASGIVQAGLIRPTVERFGERAALIAGLLCGATGFAIYGLASTGAGFWSGIPVMALWGLAGAAAMGLMSRLVGASEQGQLQGANSSIMALAGLLGPGLFTQAFARAITPGGGWHLPGAPFLLAAALLVAAAALAWRVTQGAKPVG